MARKRQRGATGETSNKRQHRANKYGIEFKNEEQWIKYNGLLDRKVKNSRWIDIKAMNELGITEHVRYLLQNIDWVNFMDGKWDTYVGLTLEFLSSLKVENKKNLPKYTKFSFRLGNTDRELTVHDLNAIYKLPPDGHDGRDEAYNASDIWNRLTRETKYNFTDNKATYLRNPVFRYIHRVFTYSIYGRGDSNGNVRQDELYLLWCMTAKHKLDGAKQILRQLETVADSNRGGDIVVGGLITPIAIHFEISLDRKQKGSGPTRVDLDGLIKQRIFGKINGQLRYVFRDGRTFPLPNTELTDVRDEIKWALDPVDDVRVDVAVHLRNALRSQTEDDSLRATDDLPLPPQCQGMSSAQAEHISKQLEALATAFQNMQQNVQCELASLSQRLGALEQQVQTVGQRADIIEQSNKQTQSAQHTLEGALHHTLRLILPIQVQMRYAHDWHVREGHHNSADVEIQRIIHTIERPTAGQPDIQAICSTASLLLEQYLLQDAANQPDSQPNHVTAGSQPTIEHDKNKLLILDLNGLLVDMVREYEPGYKPAYKIKLQHVFLRPHCHSFLEFCFERFQVGIWTSRKRENAEMLIDKGFQAYNKRFLFIWDQDWCTNAGKFPNSSKPVLLKRIRRIWRDWAGYNQTNTLLIDDSPYKALCNPEHTAIFPFQYSYKNTKDDALGPQGDLRLYLERLADAENVQQYVARNPFGQPPISEIDRDWDFYKSILDAE